MTAYSGTWFDVFARTIPLAESGREVDFLRCALPRPLFERILDVGYGTGRHAREEGRRGYVVAAIDPKAALIAWNSGRFDFDDETNELVLLGMRERLCEGADQFEWRVFSPSHSCSVHLNTLDWSGRRGDAASCRVDV